MRCFARRVRGSRSCLSLPRTLYLHGFASGPQSRKARFLHDRLAESGHLLEAPDLTAGDFERLTVGGQLRVVEDTLQGDPVTLIGSSLGGYLAALYASIHPETQRLVLLAPAFGFMDRWPDLVGPKAFDLWRRAGKLPLFHYGEGRLRQLGFQIYEESRQWPPYPTFPQPAHIFHGRADTVVLPAVSEDYAQVTPERTAHAARIGP